MWAQLIKTCERRRRINPEKYHEPRGDELVR
jgi:hypothetical protein